MSPSRRERACARTASGRSSSRTARYRYNGCMGQTGTYFYSQSKCGPLRFKNSGQTTVPPPEPPSRTGATACTLALRALSRGQIPTRALHLRDEHSLVVSFTLPLAGHEKRAPPSPASRLGIVARADWPTRATLPAVRSARASLLPTTHSTRLQHLDCPPEASSQATSTSK